MEVAITSELLTGFSARFDENQVAQVAMNAAVKNGISAAAVSYTHLDVYKRQQLFLGNRENLLLAMEDFEMQFQELKEAIKKEDEERLMERFCESSRRRLELERR